MKKKKLLKWGILTFFILLVVGFASISHLVNKVSAAKQSAELSTDAFLFKASRGEYEDPYKLMSIEAQKEIPYGNFKDSLKYPPGVFSGITDVELTGLSFMYYVGQPMTVTFNGYVTYDDGTMGELTTTYVEETVNGR